MHLEQLEPDDLLSLEIPRIAELILRTYRDSKRLSPHNLWNEYLQKWNTPEDRKREALSESISLALSYLESAGLIARWAEGGRTCFVTPLGNKAVSGETSFSDFERRRAFPKELLHPTVASKAWSDYFSGAYDDAVFKAFKELEVAVRTKCGYDHSKYGVDMMRQAFAPAGESKDGKGGPLTDESSPPAEQKSVRDLFVGAIGSYKNPHSHRHVSLEPQETAEMLMLASHLLRIVDSRPEPLEVPF